MNTANSTFTPCDAKIIGTIYGKLLELGAASPELLAKACKLEASSVEWALYQLRCTAGGGLFSLPDTMLPSGWNA